MSSLDLYDLETLSLHGLSIQSDQKKCITNADKDQKDTSETDKIQSKLILEDLPNELLMYIFEFLPFIDLLRAFYNLNFRLNSIFHNQEFKLDLSGSKRTFDYYLSNQRTLTSFVYSLKLCDEYNRLALFHRHIDIDIFENLRVLTIRKASEENFEKIISKLHMLKYLSYLNIYDVLLQSPSITSALFSIRSLKRLIIYSFEPVIFHFSNDTIRPWTNLEYLQLNSCYMTDFLELIKYVGPNLKSLFINILYKRPHDPATIDEQLINNLLSGDEGKFQIPVSLNHLYMTFNYLSLMNFHLVLKLFPSLKILTFSTWTFDIEYAISTIWHDFISRNLPQLEKIQYYITINGAAGQQCPSPELIVLFTTNLDQWVNGPIIVDYNHGRKPPYFEVYTHSQPVNNKKYNVELYGKQRFMASNHTLMSINEKATSLIITLNDNDEQLTLTNQDRTTYSKITGIRINSQLTTKPKENDSISKLICADLMKSINNISKVIGLQISVDTPTNINYPSRTLVRRLLSKMPKISRLDLNYNYLLELCKAPLMVHILAKQIDSLSITFHNDPPLVEDIERIFEALSMNLRYLYMTVPTSLPTDCFHAILPLIFNGKCKKLRFFALRLSGTTAPPQLFSTEFKIWLELSLTQLIEADSKRSTTIEYNIKAREFTIAF